MFPTPVGMNRPAGNVYRGESHVPHTRGDEPDVFEEGEGEEVCSPHPWG